ncbi:MAG: xanthine dehydrogenase family protein subunit M [Anaerolineae bacterium]|nr:xanthine dehydrogenase family protein subunit M [Anaerolineae bacterium]
MLARPGLVSFDYVRARTPGEVVQLLAEHGADARLMMGGTDLLVRIRDGAVRPRLVVDLKHLPGMRDILYQQQAGLTVGAAVTMNQLARHPAVVAHYPLLAQAANSVASYPLRNRATIGGNLCNASPCADTAPPSYVLAGRIVVHGSAGEQEVAIADFFRGPGQTVLQPGQFVTAIRFPPSPAAASGRYLKLGRNKAGDLAIVSVAVLGFPDASAPSGYRFRIALGAVAPVVLRVPAAEEWLAHHPPGAETFARAADLAAAAASPIDDVRASADYRRAMVRTLTRRGLNAVADTIAAPTGSA